MNFDLKTGFTCNNHCLHCVVDDKKYLYKEESGKFDLSTEEIEDIIINKVPKGYTVNLTGGEVTIRKDFEHIVNFIHERGFPVTIQTNGTGLNDEGLVSRIADKVEHILLAIHAFDEDVHNKIVGDRSGNMYKKTMTAFHNLVKYKVPFATQTVLSSYNIEHLYDTYKNIQKQAPGIFMHMTYPHLLGNAWLNKDTVGLKFSAIRHHIQKCLKYYAEFILTEAIPKCYLFPYQDRVAFNYDNNCFLKGQEGKSMGVDPSLPLENNSYVEDGVMQDYDLANFNDRHKGSRCKNCTFNNECPGVWKEYFQVYKKELDLYPIETKSAAIPLRSEKEECMNKCLFCEGGEAVSQDYDFEEFKQRADHFFKEGRSIFEITGEPCQHEDVVKAVKYLSDNKKVRYIQMSTHGRTLKNRKFVKQLSEAGLTHIRMPLYGSTKEIHEKTLTPKFGGSSFDDAVQGLKNCAEHGITICGQILLNRFNKDDINNIHDLYHKIAGDHLLKEVVLNFTGVSIPKYEWSEGWYVPIKDYKEYVQSFLKHTENKPYNCITIGIPFCVNGEYNPRMKNVVRKPDLGIANVNTQMASKESIKIPHYQIRSYFSECNNCDLTDICEGLPKNDLKLYGYYGLKGIKE